MEDPEELALQDAASKTFILVGIACLMGLEGDSVEGPTTRVQAQEAVEKEVADVRSEVGSAAEESGDDLAAEGIMDRVAVEAWESSEGEEGLVSGDNSWASSDEDYGGWGHSKATWASRGWVDHDSGDEQSCESWAPAGGHARRGGVHQADEVFGEFEETAAEEAAAKATAVDADAEEVEGNAPTEDAVDEGAVVEPLQEEVATGSAVDEAEEGLSEFSTETIADLAAVPCFPVWGTGQQAKGNEKDVDDDEDDEGSAVDDDDDGSFHDSDFEFSPEQIEEIEAAGARARMDWLRAKRASVCGIPA